MAKKETMYWPEDSETSIVPVEITDEVKGSMLQYSMSVLVGRAIPDVRDGLKPVHRRILYTMYENGLTPDKPYRKCADTVGKVLGSYHPHGDASVYDAMVRMAQDFSLRYPLVDGHGNFGNIDGYPAAAYRYTESRMNPLSLHMLDDIDKDTVNFVPNYDDRLKEPEVLPVRFPQLLVNGSSGIAVGMATEIPPHNLGEVIDGMCALIDNPDASLQDLLAHIKGPDFPTGGIIMGRAGIRAAYATGRGKITLRGKAEIEELTGGKQRIIITEIPYKVRKKDLVKHMYDLAAEKKIEGIDDVVDYSSKRDGGIRIIVDVKRDANAQVVLNKLYAYTALQTTISVILLAIVEGRPKVLTLREMLQNSIDFQCEIIERRTRYDRQKAAERAHILEALKVATDFIDEVIAIIRGSKTIPESKAALAERFGFDDPQTTAIVQMQLGRLAGLEKQKIADELTEKLRFIKECDEILRSHGRILDIVKTEALNLRDRYADERRTEISDVAGEVDVEDLIPNVECVLTKSVEGYIKRLPADTYSAQHRGGRGVTGMTTREGDGVESVYTCHAHDPVLLFSNLGRLYKIKAYEIPEGSRTARGMNLVNLLPLLSGEKIINILPVGTGVEETHGVLMVTRNGFIKKTPLSAFRNVRKNGILAIGIAEGDELAYAGFTGGSDDILVATASGRAVRFGEESVRDTGRAARGVRAVRMEEGDRVAGVAVCGKGDLLLTVTETGFGRISPLDDYPLRSRGGKGVINYRATRFGAVAAVLPVKGDEDLILISSDGIIIRMPLSELRVMARPAKGVRVMRPRAGETVLSVALAAHDEAEVTDHPEAPEPDSSEPGDPDEEDTGIALDPADAPDYGDAPDSGEEDA